jgi:hypothetical protein
MLISVKCFTVLYAWRIFVLSKRSTMSAVEFGVKIGFINLNSQGNETKVQIIIHSFNSVILSYYSTYRLHLFKSKFNTLIMQVSQFAPNHTIVSTDNGTYFVSYNSNIVYKPNEGPIQLGKHWNYSKTTAKYRNKYLNTTTKEIEQGIRSGEYVVNPNL